MSDGVIPRQAEPTDHGGDQVETTGHGRAQSGSTGHGGAQSEPGEDQIPRQHSEGQQHSGRQTQSRDHGGGQSTGPAPSRAVTQRRSSRFFVSRLTTATGYVALGLLGLTLLIGPGNLLLRERNPVSSYLCRDVGTWTAVFSVVHVILGLQLHSGGQLSGFLEYFVADGKLLTNTFGLGNWTGLVATAIVVGLLALSNDFALRILKARTWK